MTNGAASQIVRAMLRQRRVRTTREEVEALDMAATLLEAADYVPRTGIEVYCENGLRRGLVPRQRQRLETP